MSFAATLRQSGGSIILAIPKTIARTLAIEAGSIVELAIEGGKLSVTPARRSLADRLKASPKSPAAWGRDDVSLRDGAVGRELL
ncbi:MAG TPA: AbrB/MazE/SpoVT family DNA-binding domain-containing protein [Xanthomonadaceae bacterium]|nr:AbrB/MazE/SpoVT family DNA-binding domain-containing protein [Xanthomonadaceae bacterium]